MHITFLKGTSKENYSCHRVLVTWEVDGAKANRSWLLVEALYLPEEGREAPLANEDSGEGENMRPVYSLSQNVFIHFVYITDLF